MRKTALIIMLITFFSKVIGFGRDVLLSYYFGASNVSDAYLISLTIPSILFGFVATGIVAAYIPIQSNIIDTSGEEEGDKFTSNFTNIILIIVAIIIAIGLLFTEPIVKMFAIGFSGAILNQAIIMTRITLFGMFFSALVTIYSGYLA